MQIVDILPAYNFIFHQMSPGVLQVFKTQGRKDEKTNTDIFVC